MEIIILSAAGAFTLFMLAREGVRWMARKKWPSAEATILYGRIKQTSESGYPIEICYAFSVNGERYSGFDDGPEFATEAEANAYIQKIPETKIRIRYNPANPDQSVTVI